MRITAYRQMREDSGYGDEEFLSALNQDLIDIDQRLSVLTKYRTVVKTVVIRTGGTEIQHGIGRTPRSVFITPKGDIRFWEYQARTRDSVFLKSSADGEAEVRIEG